ncbi:MAG: cupin domain-containing protein [Nitrospiraceae bacterium]|nr:cupin domain-containing protein [Nitrospiraceae bacterium]
MKKTLVLDVKKTSKFGEKKPRKKVVWKGEAARIALIGLLPGQQIDPHEHDGIHIWIVMEGNGQFLAEGKKPKAIGPGQIFVVPTGEHHGIRNATRKKLVLASISA